MDNELFPQTRRVVTAIDDDGLSYFAEDGPAPAVLTVAARPGYRNNNIWRTEGGRSRVDAPDTTSQQSGVLPPRGGSVIRVIDHPPRPSDPAERQRQAEATFAAMFPDAKHQPGHARAAGMHITDTIDYAVVLSGEIVAIMENGEKTLRTGDILIQRGTNHAWENRSDKPARMLFVLLDAER